MSLLPVDPQSNAQSAGGAPTPSAAAPAPVTPSKKKAGEAVSDAFSSLRVSLMPSDLEGTSGPDLGRRLLIFALVIVVETAILGVLYLFASQAVSAATAKRDSVLVEIDKEDRAVAAKESGATAAADYAYQVAAANATLDEHLYWSNFFAFLEKRTRPGVSYDNFSGDAGSGTVTLEASALSYHDAAEQIIALRDDPEVVSVMSTSAAARISDKGQVSGVAFTLVVKCKQEVWRASKNGIPPATISVPSVVPPTTGITPSAGTPGVVAPSAGAASGTPVVIPATAPSAGTTANVNAAPPADLFPSSSPVPPPAP